MFPAWIAQSFYIGVFIGVVTLGEAALIPAIYVGHTGTFSLPLIIGIAFIATMAADAFWYSLGYFVPQEKLLRYRFIARRVNQASPLTAFFQKNRLRLLFYSKFFYSTRIVFQLLAGFTRTRLTTYLFVNALSTTVWLIVLTSVGILLGESIKQFRDVVFGIEIVVTTGVAAIVLFYILGNWLLRRLMKKWR